MTFRQVHALDLGSCDPLRRAGHDLEVSPFSFIFLDFPNARSPSAALPNTLPHIFLLHDLSARACS
jgi:hypothetical protein